MKHGDSSLSSVESDRTVPFDNLSEQQANIEFNFLCENTNNIRFVHYRRDYIEAEQKLNNQIINYMYEGGDKNHNTWDSFKETQIKDNIHNFRIDCPDKFTELDEYRARLEKE